METSVNGTGKLPSVRRGRFVFGTAGVCIAIGIDGILGWSLGVPMLGSHLPSERMMSPHAALAAVLAGIILMLAYPARRTPACRIVCTTLAILLAVFGATNLVEMAILRPAVPIGIEPGLLLNPSWTGPLSDLMMRPVTALSYTVLGVALLMLGNGRSFNLVQGLTIPVALMSYIDLITYLFGITDQFVATSSLLGQMALQTVISLLLITGGLLVSRQGFLADWLNETRTRRIILRNYLPIALAVPIVCGFLQILAVRRGLADPIFAEAVGSVATSLVFLGVFVWAARALSVMERKLQQAHDDLERRVDERASQLARANSELAEQGRLFMALIENGMDVIVTVDRDGIVKYLSPSIHRILGYEPEEILGTTPWWFIDRETLSPLKGFLEESHDTIRNVRIPALRVRHKDGSWRWLEATCTDFLGDPSINALVINARDTTQRIVDDNRRRAEQARLRSLLAASELEPDSLGHILEFALDESLKLTGSHYGHVYRYDEKAKMLTLVAWSQGVLEDCQLPRRQAERRLGQTGYWGEAIRQRRALIVNDFTAPDSSRKGLPEGHVKLTRFMNVPIFRNNRIVALVGVANKEAPYEEDDIIQIRLYMEGIWNLIERKSAENELERVRRQTDLILSSAGEGICGLDGSGHTTFINPAAERMLGYEQGELNDSTVIHPFIHHSGVDGTPIKQGDCPICTGLTEDRQLSDDTEAFWRKDGSFFPVAYTRSPLRDETGTITGAVLVFKDISERKHTENLLEQYRSHLEELVEQRTSELYRERTLLRTLIDAIPEQIYAKDANRLITLANRGAVRILGGGAEDRVIGHGTSELLPEEIERQSATEEHALLAGERATVAREAQLVTAQDGARWFSLVKVPFTNEQGQRIGIVCITRDITQDKAAEELLERAKEEAERANAAKSTFLANMSHEIRTPMNAILGFTQLMLNDQGITERSRSRLVTVNKAGEHLLNLINQILEISKIESGRSQVELRAFDFVALLEEVEALFTFTTTAKGVSFLASVEDNFPRYIESDQGKVRQILTNIIGNAVKFVETGGVAIRARADRVDDEASRIVIEVEDTGPGIAKEELPELFKVFYQSSAGRTTGGTGLGLSLSREFARLLGGDITIESELGTGSRVRIEFMAKRVTSSDIATREPASRVIHLEPGQKTFRILIADDREDNRTVLREMLDAGFFAVREVTNGKDAVAVAEEWRPDLILMDMRMPVMDGYTATRTIKSTPWGNSIPIIAITASAFDEDRQKILDTGVDNFLRKPFKLNEILAAVSTLLGIRYSYTDTEEKEEEATGQQTVDMAGLGAEFRTAMREAALNADQDRLAELLASTEAQILPSPLRKQLNREIADYQYETIRELFTREA